MIQIKNLSQIYLLKFHNELKQWSEQKLYALKDINLELESGKCAVILGANGSGKTTLLKIIAGLIEPSSGEIEISGRCATIMDLGVGFHPDLTGRENLLQLSPLYGISKESLECRLEKIEKFADLGRFFNAPLRTYSQGMYLRLAFSFAIHLEPDIFLVDDILAVGDEQARKRCLQKFRELKAQGKTIVLVTHDLGLAKEFGDKGFWIQDGCIRKRGSAIDIIDAYQKHCKINHIPLETQTSNLSIEISKDNHFVFFREELLLDLNQLRLGFLFESQSYLFSFDSLLESGPHFLKIQLCVGSLDLIVIWTISIDSHNDEIQMEWFLETGSYFPIHLFKWEFLGDGFQTYKLHDKPQVPSLALLDQQIDLLQANGERDYSLLLNISPKDSILKLDKAGKLKINWPENNANRQLGERLFSIKTRVISKKINSSIQRLEKNYKEIDCFIHSNSINWRIWPRGFSAVSNGKEIFSHSGFDFFFTLSSGQKCFSHEGFYTLDKIAEGDLQRKYRFTVTHSNWPISIEVFLEIEQSSFSLVFKIIGNTKWVNSFKGQVFFANIFLNKSQVQPGNSSEENHLEIEGHHFWLSSFFKKDEPHFLIFNEFNSQDSKSYIIGVHKPQIDKDEIIGLDFKSSENKLTQSDPIFKGCLNLPKSLFLNPTGYVSILRRDMWHDSMQAYWRKTDDNEYTGQLPWLSGQLNCFTEEIDQSELILKWQLVLVEDITAIKKIQLCIAIDKNSIVDILNLNYENKLSSSSIQSGYIKALDLREEIVIHNEDESIHLTVESEENRKWQLSLEDINEETSLLNINFSPDSWILEKSTFSFPTLYIRLKSFTPQS